MGNVLVVAGPYMGLDRHKFFCLLVTFLLFFSAVFVPQISIPGGESVMSLVGRLYPVPIYMYGVKVPCSSRPGFFQIFSAREEKRPLLAIACTRTLSYFSFRSFRKHRRARERKIKNVYFLFPSPLSPRAKKETVILPSS